jgi:hypothetical protein
VLKSEKLLEYEQWIEDWLREHPQPRAPRGRTREVRRARWRLAQAAWLEYRRLVRKAERELVRGLVSSMSLLPEGVDGKNDE